MFDPNKKCENCWSCNIDEYPGTGKYCILGHMPDCWRPCCCFWKEREETMLIESCDNCHHNELNMNTSKKRCSIGMEPGNRMRSCSYWAREGSGRVYSCSTCHFAEKIDNIFKCFNKDKDDSKMIKADLCDKYRRKHSMEEIKDNSDVILKIYLYKKHIVMYTPDRFNYRLQRKMDETAIFGISSNKKVIGVSSEAMAAITDTQIDVGYHGSIKPDISMLKNCVVWRGAPNSVKPIITLKTIVEATTRFEYIENKYIPRTAEIFIDQLIRKNEIRKQSVIV